jgi:hypothetical protein
MKSLFLLLILVSFNSLAQTSCGPGLFKIRSGAKINLLDIGSHIKFLKDVKLPSYDTTKKISSNIWVKYPPSTQSKLIKKGTFKKVIRVNATEDGYVLILDNFYPVYIGNQYPKYEIETVGGLEKASKFILLMCKYS